MKLWDQFCWTYTTKLPATECMKLIQQQPWTFGRNIFNLQQYECSQLESDQIRIVFKGAQFGKILRTEYLLTFAENADTCNIVANFQRELFGMPPMTSTYQLDIFMEEKIHARRIN